MQKVVSIFAKIFQQNVFNLLHVYGPIVENGEYQTSKNEEAHGLYHKIEATSEQ